MTLVAALSEEWAAIDALVGDLTPEQWLAPTPCPAWDVRDQLAHIVAAEYVLAGRLGTPGETPDAELYASAGMFMVDVREESTRSLLERFREVTIERLAALADLSPTSKTWTPVGPGTVDRLVRLRVFDCWMHEQDIRDALGRPGHEDGPAARIVLDEIERALPYIVARRAGAPDGSAVTIEATGPAARTWHLLVEAGRAHVGAPQGEPTVGLRLPTGILTRLCGGRIDPRAALPSVCVDGHGDLAGRIVANLAFTR